MLLLASRTTNIGEIEEIDKKLQTKNIEFLQI